MPRVKRTESLPEGEARPLSEISNGQPAAIEPINGSLKMDAVELERFMHEEVVIRVAPSREGGALEVINPQVNDKNQPIVRGVKTPVKRKYVEDLARSYTVAYEQRVQDPSRPENIQMIAKPVLDYPFQVIEDTPKGWAWLDAIQEQVRQEVARA